VRSLVFLQLALTCFPGALHAGVTAGRYNMAAVGDTSALETCAIEDWHPWGKGTGIRQKCVEITVCEWWPGQKERLPGTLLAPESGGPCKNLIISVHQHIAAGSTPTLSSPLLHAKAE